MKKKSLLLILLMVLLAPWAAKGQTLFSEDFEAGTMPTGWTTDGPGTWSIGTGDDGTSTGAGHGSYNAKITHGTTNNVTKLITPSIDLSTVTSAELSFMHVQRSWSGDIDQLRVYYRASSTDSWTLLTGQTYTTAVSSWKTENEINLPNLSSTYQIAFEMTDKYGHGVGVDYVQIVQGASCIKPAGLAATLTPGNGTIATLSWTKVGEEANWILQYGTDSEFATYETYDGSFTIEGTTISAGLMTLTPETTYYARVKADCGGGDESDWSNVCTFKPTNTFSVTLNDGTSSNYYVPTYYNNTTSYKYVRSQFILPSSDLDVNMIGGRITSLKFYYNAASYTSYAPFTIYMTEVDAATLSTSFVDWEGMTPVYTGTLAVSGNIMELTLDTPYTYQGGNLLIGFMKDPDTNGSYTGSSSSWKGATPTSGSSRYYAKSSLPALTGGTASTFLPKITISYFESATPMPKNLIVSDIDVHSATVSWTAPSTNVTSYKYQYQPEGGEWTTLTSTTALSVPLSGLAANTTYNFKVQAIYSGGESVFASTTFLTACDPNPNSTFPWSENFDKYPGTTATNTNNLPQCWNHINNTTSDWNGYPIVYETTNTHSGANALVMRSSVDYDAQDQYAILPSMANVNSLKISLWARQWNTTSSPTFTIGVMTDPADASTFVAIKTISPASTTYEEFVTGLDSYNGTGNFIAFKMLAAYDETGHSQHAVFIDDITIEELPPCPDPTELTVSEVTSHTAYLSWLKGSVSQSAWQVYYSTDPTTPADDIPTSQVTPANTQGLVLENLVAGKEYYAWVRGDCTGSDNGYSAWTDKVFFFTPLACQAPTAPMVDEITGKTATFSWTSNAGDYDVKYGQRPTSTEQGLTYNVTQTNYYGSSSASYRTWGVKYPAGQITGNVLTKVEFWYNPTYNYATEKTIQIDVYSGGNLAPGALLYSEVAYPDATATAGLRTITLANPVNIINGENLWITITEYGTYTLAVGDCTDDDNRWILSGGKWVTWGVDGKGWIINGYMETWDFAASSWTSASCTTNNCSLSGLTPETDHVAMVRSDCGSTEGTSLWAIAPFTTDVACPAPTGVTVSNETSHGATIAWTGVSDSYKVMVGEVAPTPIKSFNFEGTAIPDDFTNSTTYPWTITDADKHNGSQSAKSGGAGIGYASSDLTLNVNLEYAASITFWAKVSSESGYDYGRFFIDETQKFQVSGTTGDWTEYSYDLSAGDHTLIWRYYKDSGTDDGDDCFYVDDITIIANTISSWRTYTTDASPYVLYDATNINPETNYGVKVVGVCDAVDGNASGIVNFTTLESCPTPTGVAITDLGHYDATVSWLGDSPYYIVNYRTAACVDGVSEHFDGTSLPANWTNGSGALNTDGTATITSGNYWSFGTNCGVFDNHAFFNMYSDRNYWLIAPSVTVGEGYSFSFDVAYTAYDNYGNNEDPEEDGPHKLYVLISTDNQAHWTILREWNNSGSSYVLDEIPKTGQTINDISLSPYMGQTVDIAFLGVSSTTDYDNNIHIDNVFIGKNIEAGAWQTVSPNPTTTTASITGLAAGTKYDVTIKPSCNETLISDIANFTTLSANTKYFITAGNWTDAANWMDEEIPTIANDAVIRANAIIPSNGVGNAKKITFEGTTTPTLTIADGGQLYTNNAVNVTMQKAISGATSWGESTAATDGWYLISSPVGQILSSQIDTKAVNLKAAPSLGVPQFDLYKYDEANITWKNFNDESFALYRGFGYLYARHEGTTINFVGALSVTNATPALSYAATNPDYKGWNLLGNPFSHNITWANMTTTNVNNAGYYRMENGAWITEPSTTAIIKPMEGFLVAANGEDPTITIKNVATAKDRANNEYLAFTASSDKYYDVTYAMFSDDESLDKINHRNTLVPMVYIPQGGQRYAIATMSDDTEMFNLNFKAMTAGMYALSYKANGHFDYLHVIDRLTGEDINMLYESKYEFMASPRDDENRFIVKLRYNANGNVGADDIFAYQNGDEIIVNGEGTLQVFDVMGRFVGNYNVNGNTRISASQFSNAVYIFRLVGDDVKTQKIVVR